MVRPSIIRVGFGVDEYVRERVVVKYRQVLISPSSLSLFHLCIDISTPGGGNSNGERISVATAPVARTFEMDNKALLV